MSKVKLISTPLHDGNSTRGVGEYTRRLMSMIQYQDKDFDIVHRNDLGFVVVINCSDVQERENLINYCKDNKLEWTECPRYIRLNKPAISIEVKRT